jgi:DNA-binding FrmR family transcriptional regulator
MVQCRPRATINITAVCARCGALDEERDCSEVLQVMSAARGAMNSLMAELLEGHIRCHVLNGKHKASSQQIVAADEVIDMVKSYLK